MLLLQVVTRVVGRRITDDGEDLVLRHEPPSFAQRGGRVALVICELEYASLTPLISWLSLNSWIRLHTDRRSALCAKLPTPRR